MTAAQYQERWRGGDGPPVPPPPGLLFRAGVGEGEEVFTGTVWESREAYGAFAPAFTRAMRGRGFAFGPPRIPPVHHVLEPGRAAPT
jgi:hypothetical protein